MVITLPKKMSQEKVDVLLALGAIVKRTPTNAPCPVDKPGYPYSHIAKAIKIRDQLNEGDPVPGNRADIMDQYSNPSNPLAHIEGTAQELLRQCDGKPVGFLLFRFSRYGASCASCSSPFLIATCIWICHRAGLT